MSKYKCFDGYCPEQESYETIEIYYARIPILSRDLGIRKLISNVLITMNTTVNLQVETNVLFI